MSALSESSSTRRTQILYALSFFSGVAALVYEVVWARMLSFTFGSTTVAASTVVAAFLGGMGLGAWGYHRLHRRFGNALRLYGVIEIGIAATTLGLTIAFEFLPEGVARVAAVMPAGLWMGLFRFLVVFILLLVPAVLMGATYPALCTGIIRSRSGVDRHLGFIYGLNTVGAAAGAFLAGLLLIEWVGLRASVFVGNTINVAVAITALLLARGSAPSTSSETLPEETIRTALPFWLTGLVLFGSGWATLSFEILWFRGLRYLVGNSTYALTIILAVFLTGLGFGALFFRRAAQRRWPERDLAFIQLGICLLSLGAVGAEALLLAQPELSSRVSVYQASVRTLPWVLVLAIHTSLSFVIMLPATLLMGLSFPLASRLYLGNLRQLGARVGGAYLLSNLGSILGSLCAAVLLLPTVGTIGGTRLVAAVNLLLGALVLWRIAHPRRVAWLSGAVVTMLALNLVLPGSLRFEGPGRGSEQHLEGTILYEKEGDLGTVQVRARPGRPNVRGISIDGTVIGISNGWNYALYSKQILLAHLAMALDTRVRRTLNIGLGSASTLHATASHPFLEVLDCVEINPAVVQGASFFVESRVFRDPRVRVIVDDASHYLLRTTESYDVIISDGKQAADYSGNAKLLSQDFYSQALHRLSESGLFVQWIPLGTLPREFQTILRTFAEVFPVMEVFFDAPGSVLIVGSRHPLPGRPEPTPAEFAEWGAARDLDAFGIPGRSALLSRWVASREQIREMVGSGAITTWDHTTLEFAPYKATREEWKEAPRRNLALLVAANEAGSSEAGEEYADPTAPFGASTALLRKAYLRFMEGNREEALSLATRAVGVNPEDPRARRMVAQLGAPAAPEGSHE